MKKSVIAFGMAVAAVTIAIPATASAKDKAVIYENGDTKITAFGDMRFRWETDTTTQTGKDDKTRSRQRIRLRFGNEISFNENLTMGYRVATGALDNHSTHHDLSIIGGGKDEGTFGIDRGYIKLKFDSLWAWFGKKGNIIWDPMSATWDSDLQPEGIALGFKNEMFFASVAQYQLTYSGWDDKNDTMLAYQLGGEFGGDIKVKAAVGGYAITEEDADNADSSYMVPGGTASYNHILAEITAKELPLSPVLGAIFVSSDVEDKYIGDGVESADKNAMVIWAKAKLPADVGLTLAYHDIGFAGATGLGWFTQDDFPYTNNYTGYTVQVSKKVLDQMKVGLKYYSQTTKNEKIAPTEAYEAMIGKGKDRTRIQLNLDVSF